MAKPTILLIPGALTAPSCYDLTVPHIQKAGYPTVQAPLASNNPPHPTAHTAETDGQFLLDRYLLPLLKEGKQVIVFAHSFGATSMTGAGKNLVKGSRGLKSELGGIVGIIYISGALVPDGQSQVEYLGGSLPPFCKIDHPAPGLFVFDPVIPYLFNDTDTATAENLAKSHLPHAFKPMETPVSAPLWTEPALDGRRVYFKTLLDQTFPPEAQQMFIDNSGEEWEVVEVEGGHEAFLTKPQLVADAIVKVAQGWSSG